MRTAVSLVTAASLPPEQPLANGPHAGHRRAPPWAPGWAPRTGRIRTGGIRCSGRSGARWREADRRRARAKPAAEHFPAAGTVLDVRAMPTRPFPHRARLRPCRPAAQVRRCCRPALRERRPRGARPRHPTGPTGSTIPITPTRSAAPSRPGAARFGVLVCGTGIGMSIAANRHAAHPLRARLRAVDRAVWRAPITTPTCWRSAVAHHRRGYGAGHPARLPRRHLRGRPPRPAPRQARPRPEASLSNERRRSAAERSSPPRSPRPIPSSPPPSAANCAASRTASS